MMHGYVDRKLMVKISVTYNRRIQTRFWHSQLRNSLQRLRAFAL